jgi:hypothetical protein
LELDEDGKHAVGHEAVLRASLQEASMGPRGDEHLIMLPVLPTPGKIIRPRMFFFSKQLKYIAFLQKFSLQTDRKIM